MSSSDDERIEAFIDDMHGAQQDWRAIDTFDFEFEDCPVMVYVPSGLGRIRMGFWADAWQDWPAAWYCAVKREPLETQPTYWHPIPEEPVNRLAVSQPIA